MHSDNPTVAGVRLLAGGSFGVDSRRFIEPCVFGAANVGVLDSRASIGSDDTHDTHGTNRTDGADGTYRRDGKSGLLSFYADPVGEILGNEKWLNVILSSFGTFTTANKRNSRSRTRSVCT